MRPMNEEMPLPEPDDSYDRDRQREVLSKVAEALAERRLTAPAIFTLEAGKPLSYLVSQTLVFFQPLVQTLFGLRDYQVFAAALEDRDNVEWLIQQLEAHEEKAGQERRKVREPDKGDEERK